VTKHNYLVTRASDVGPTLREAFAVARSGRPGPVLVDITKDAQQASAPFAWDAWAPRLRRAPVRAAIAGGDPFERARAFIDGAERPVILAGQGIVQSGAGSALRALAERTGIPVACTLLGLGGFPASHPLALGMMGMHGEAWVNAAIQRADLLVALGMRFDDRVTGNLKTFAPHAKKIHVEIDPAEINKNVKVDVALVGDVASVLADLVPRVAPRVRRPWLDSIDAAKRAAQTRDIQRIADDGKLYAAHVIHDLCAMTKDAIVVTDVGQHQMWEAQYWRHEDPRSLVTSGGLGTMGFALPAAVGARFAHPEREIWVIAGDGGFQMTACELSTIAQEGIKLHVAVINNGYLGMVRQWQEFFYGRRYAATPIKSPDFVKLAEAHDLTGLRVTRRDEIAGAVRRARAAPGTVVIEFRVEAEDSVYPMVPAGADLDDMIRRPLSAELAVEQAETD
jgi:acetolactate synthase-1/2/3 large subunit